MGLDTTHDAWSGPYSAFSRWRNELAKAAGYALIESPGKYGANVDYDIPEWDDRLSLDEVQGKWDRTLDEPLVYLLWHSDCDGKIKPKQARLIADRLEELLPALDADDSQSRGHSTRQLTQRFIDGLRLAVSEKNPVRFW